MSEFEIPQLPTYTTKVPSTGKSVRFRPFTVREESFLLQAKETKEDFDILDAITAVVGNCYTGVDVSKLALIDIEWLFLQLRIRSVAEDVELSYRCTNEVDGKTCGAVFSSLVNLSKVELKGEPKITKEFSFPSGTYILTFRQPPISAANAKTKIEQFWLQLESIVDPKGKVFGKDDLTPEKFEDFVMTFKTSQFAELEQALNNVARIYYKDTLECPKCGAKTEIEYKSLLDFFT